MGGDEALIGVDNYHSFRFISSLEDPLSVLDDLLTCLTADWTLNRKYLGVVGFLNYGK